MLLYEAVETISAISAISGKLIAQIRHGARLRFLAKVFFNLGPKAKSRQPLSSSVY